MVRPSTAGSRIRRRLLGRRAHGARCHRQRCESGQRQRTCGPVGAGPCPPQMPGNSSRGGRRAQGASSVGSPAVCSVVGRHGLVHPPRLRRCLADRAPVVRPAGHNEQRCSARPGQDLCRAQQQGVLGRRHRAPSVHARQNREQDAVRPGHHRSVLHPAGGRQHLRHSQLSGGWAEVHLRRELCAVPGRGRLKPAALRRPRNLSERRPARALASARPAATHLRCRRSG
jgi:hypothetical protein